MFETNRTTTLGKVNYIGARVTDAEEQWLRAEMERRGVSMSDLIRIGLRKLREK